ncbi:MAG: ATP-binding protein, partial [Spirulina sp.]
MSRAEIEEFARVLELSAGTFRLFLVRCNSVGWRSRAMEELKSACSLALEELEVDPEETQLYDRIVAKVGEQTPEGLMVVGLERNRYLDRLLDRANQERDKYIKNLSFPLIIWTSDRIFARLLREASDFQSIAETLEFALPAEFWKDFIAETATQRLDAILQQGATRFLPPLPSERNPAFTDELQAAEEKLSNSTSQTRAYLAFLQARSRGYEETEARTAYEESLNQWPQDGELSHLAMIRYCLGDWWRAQTRLHRREAATAWENARQQFEECLALLRQTERSELVARFINALGDALLAAGQWSALESLAREGVELQQTYANPLRRSRAWGFLAEVALASENWSLAERHVREAIGILETVGDDAELKREEGLDIKFVRAFNRFALARSQRGQKQYKQSLETLTLALKETKPEYELDLYLAILQALQDGYWQQKNYLQAYRYKRQRQDLETQFGLRAFLGAGRIKPQKIEQILRRSEEENSEEVALEIRVSGRMEDVDKLVERVGRNDCKVTVLYGSSGVGKSSLITGGLLPRLWQERVGNDCERVLPIYLRSYRDWEQVLGEILHQSLARIESNGDRPNSRSEILEVLKRCCDRRIRPVLLFDQFEEFFFVYGERPKRNEFFAFLGQCLELLPLKILFVLRVEYIYLLLERPGFECVDGEVLSKNVRYLLDYFSLEQAHNVIEDLIGRARVDWERGLIETVVADLAGGYTLIRAIELQIVGAQMQQERIQTIAAYEKAGGREVLVSHYFTEVIQDCGKSNEQLAGSVLFHLTNDQGQRPLKTQDDLIKELALVSRADANRFEDVLEILVISELVMEVKDKPTRYQLVHDYLVKPIRHWYDRGLRQKIEQLERDKQQAKRRQGMLQWSLTGGAIVAA